MCSASEQEIIEICLSFSSGTAAGYDHVSVDLVKDCAHFICCPLTHIINLSMTSRIVPDQRKIARVILIFKSGDKSSFSNYAPVSALPSFSKILYNRLLDYLRKHKILSYNQFRFRKHQAPEYDLKGCLCKNHPLNFASKIILPETLVTERLYQG